MLPGPHEGVHAAAGFSLPIEIDWPNVVVEPLIGHGDKFTEPELFTDVSFRPLIAALRAIGRNQISGDALKDGLTRSHPATLLALRSTARRPNKPWALLAHSVQASGTKRKAERIARRVATSSSVRSSAKAASPTRKVLVSPTSSTMRASPPRSSRAASRTQ